MVKQIRVMRAAIQSLILQKDWQRMKQEHSLRQVWLDSEDYKSGNRPATSNGQVSAKHRRAKRQQGVIDNNVEEQHLEKPRMDELHLE